MAAPAPPAAPAFAYIRVKRRRATLFLKVTPADTVAAVLGRVQALLQQPAADMRLVKDGRPLTDDGTTLAEAGVVDGDAVAVVFRNDAARGGWEAVDVEEFDVGGGGGGE